MAYKTVVEVEVVLDEWDDEGIIEELSSRGYNVTKTEDTVYVEAFEREDWQLLLEMVDNNPQTLYTLRVREKLLKARFG
jgi:translation initiation factor IF-2